MSLVSDIVQTALRDGLGLVQDFGVTPFSVSVRTYSWSSGEVGFGTRTATDILIEPNPERKLNQDGSITLTSIIPPGINTIYTYDDLNRQDQTGEEFVYAVSGPNGEQLYTFGSLDTSSPFGWSMTLYPLSRGGPEG